MLDELDHYDWAEVFGEGSGGNCTPIVPSRYILDTDTPMLTFSREDVKTIYGQEEGEREERDWIIWGKLKDGRWFIARGGCDYTGWDCQASNSGDVANKKSILIRYCMSEDERERFGLKLRDE